MTTLKERRLNWQSCHNARDLGGLPTVDGGAVRPRALIRTDNHDRLGEQGQTALRNSGVSLILDLRNRWEAEKYPSPFRGEAFYKNLPLEDEDAAEDQARMRAEAGLFGIYRVMLDRFQARAGATVAAMADAPSGALVVHCHAGKDRTGLVVALALSVAEVSPEVIAEELAKAPDEATRERWRALQHAKPETMLATLRHLEDEYGGVKAYLLGGGVTRDQLEALRERLTTSSR